MNKYENYFINVLKETEKLSTCIAKNVGAILVSEKRIISIGYNGVSSKQKHCNEIFKKNNYRPNHHEWSENNEIHAEVNCLGFALKNNVSIENAIMFVSISPCINCAKLIVACGIKKIYYLKKYKDETGLKFLKNNGVKIYETKN